MTKKSIKLHDTTLAIRLPKALADQLDQVATAQYMKVSELVRQLIKEHLRQAQPFVGTVPNTTGQQNKRSHLEAMSPAQRAQYEADWG